MKGQPILRAGMQSAKKLPPNLKGNDFQEGLRKLVGIATFSDRTHFFEWVRMRERKAVKERNFIGPAKSSVESIEVIQTPENKQNWQDNPILKPIHVHHETRHLGWISVTTAVFIGIAIGQKSDHFADRRLAIQIAEDFLATKKLAKPQDPKPALEIHPPATK